MILLPHMYIVSLYTNHLLHKFTMVATSSAHVSTIPYQDFKTKLNLKEEVRITIKSK